MVNKLIDEYKEVFDFNKNFFKFYNQKKSIVVISIALLIIFVAGVLTTAFYNPIYYILVILSLILLYYFHTVQTNRVLSIIYNDATKSKYFDMKAKEYCKRIKKTYKIDFQDSDEVIRILTLLEREIKDARVNDLIGKGIIITFSLTLWFCFTLSIFLVGVKTFSVGYANFVILMLNLITVLVIVWLFKNSIMNSYFSSYDKLKHMREIIEDEHRVCVMKKKAEEENKTEWGM